MLLKGALGKMRKQQQYRMEWGSLWRDQLESYRDDLDMSGEVY